MGCFSYLCKECGEGVNSDSETGEECRLFLLVDGEVVERKQGQYDSYGGVFHDHEWRTKDWESIVDLHFSNSDKDGIAAIHERCFKSEPTTKSKDDPDQGWNWYEGISSDAMQAWDDDDECAA